MQEKLWRSEPQRKSVHDPRHPYTWGLLRHCLLFPVGNDELYTIPGMPPTLIDPPDGDAYACRNEYALGIDYEKNAA